MRTSLCLGGDFYKTSSYGSRVFPLFGSVKAVFAGGISFIAYYCHIDCDSGTICMMKVQPATVLSTVR